jgi:peroxin-1
MNVKTCVMFLLPIVDNLINGCSIIQILKAVGRKVLISPSVDLDGVAAATEGYSGADLQALVYNAHLEVIHASLADTSDKQDVPDEAETPIEFTSFGVPAATSIVSKADDMALQRRVGFFGRVCRWSH